MSISFEKFPIPLPSTIPTVGSCGYNFFIWSAVFCRRLICFSVIVYLIYSMKMGRAKISRRFLSEHFIGYVHDEAPADLIRSPQNPLPKDLQDESPDHTKAEPPAHRVS